MTRVNHVKKARKDQGTCRGCGTEIKTGDSYQWIQFRYGGRTVKCSACRFRGSELTQSKLSQVYAAQEAVGDALEAWDGRELDDLKADCENALDDIREVAQEYQDAADAIREVADNSIADQNEERAQELESWCDDIDSALSDLSEFEPEEAEKKADDADADSEDKPMTPEWEEWAENVRNVIEDAFVHSCPL
jgi:DNA repair ATPase RecN